MVRQFRCDDPRKSWVARAPRTDRVGPTRVPIVGARSAGSVVVRRSGGPGGLVGVLGRQARTGSVGSAGGGSTRKHRPRGGGGVRLASECASRILAAVADRCRDRLRAG